MLEWLSLAEFEGGHADVMPVRLENMTMADQAAQMATSDVLVGMHGAGCTHLLFLPPHSAIVELFNMHDYDEEYLKLALLSNHLYFSWTGSNPDKHHVREDLVRDDGRINHRLADEEIEESVVDVVKTAAHAVFHAREKPWFEWYDGQI
mmetsp:Transcript_36278/g.84189  ORF Transcript_36278/g.84189 Transcript_36278/m.84189 type:complete len:149 (-) Transcript_36278:88-534(-)